MSRVLPLCEASTGKVSTSLSLCWNAEKQGFWPFGALQASEARLPQPLLVELTLEWPQEYIVRVSITRHILSENSATRAKQMSGGVIAVLCYSAVY